MNSTAPDIVLIHGLWMTPLSWENWIARYESRGHNVSAPAWPGMDGDIEQLRRDPSKIAKLDIKQIVDHYDGIIRPLDPQPIIMGHSFGGTFTQILLDRGLGAAGVGVDSGTVKGILELPLVTLKSASPILANPFNRNKATALSAKQFHYAFTNTLSEEESQKVYDRYAVPAVNRVLFQGAAANLNPNSPMKVNFANDDRAPLLLIGGGDDHVVPAKINKKNAEKYSKSKAVTEFKEFPGRSHYTVGQPGWEEVADYALEWAVAHARSPVPA